MIGTNSGKIDSALLDLEVIIQAIRLLRLDGFERPGAECHALAILSDVAVEKAAKLRAAIFPDEPPGGHDEVAAR